MDQSLASEAVQAGNSSGRDIDKFAAFRVTPVPAERVAQSVDGPCAEQR